MIQLIITFILFHIIVAEFMFNSEPKEDIKTDDVFYFIILYSFAFLFIIIIWFFITKVITFWTANAVLQPIEGTNLISTLSLILLSTYLILNLIVYTYNLFKKLILFKNTDKMKKKEVYLIFLSVSIFIILHSWIFWIKFNLLIINVILSILFLMILYLLFEKIKYKFLKKKISKIYKNLIIEWRKHEAEELRNAIMFDKTEEIERYVRMYQDLY